MLDKGACLRFYKRKDIQEAIVAHARNKEVGTRYGDTFGKRPDALSYPQEILNLAMQGVTSFHCSEELWENPLFLGSNSSRKELDELRIGWDLVLDIDCAIVDYSKICADLIIKFLRYNGAEDISLKFSGNKGFHIGIPFEAFPKQVGNSLTKNLFPEASKKIALYIKENIKRELARRIMEFENNDFTAVRQKVGLDKGGIICYEKNEFGDNVPLLDVEPFLGIDTILLSSRHLYRMPYSLHEKSGLVSLPISPDKVIDFSKEMAKPEVILTPMFEFLCREVSRESARELLIKAMDFEVKVKEDKAREEFSEKHKHNKDRNFEEFKIESPIKEEFFPPCIKTVLKGMEDGRKRSVFVLMNFLGKLGWSREEIEAYLHKWNKEKNRESLREVYIKGQMSNFKGDKLPPNCNNEAYYKGLRICTPDSLCTKIKNPVNYTLLKWKRWLREKEEGEGKKKKTLKTSVRASS
ncbi:MAG: hypothetical protein AB1668_00060 [Nanoarchaeota archaeon]